MSATRVAILLALAVPARAGIFGRTASEEPPPQAPQKPEVDHVAASPAPTSPGSLFVEVEALNLLGMDVNARQVGDLVTVEIVEQTSTQVGSETSTHRDNDVKLGVDSLLGLETSIPGANPSMGGKIGIGISGDRSFNGDGSTSRDSVVQAVLTCEVIDILDSGNLRIWGWKEVRVNRETQYLVLDGIVRPEDIQLDNTVRSDLLAQSHIEITGRGVVADREGPGIGTRILDHAWPF